MNLDVGKVACNIIQFSNLRKSANGGEPNDSLCNESLEISRNAKASVPINPAKPVPAVAVVAADGLT
jgi:hypothetical protein